MSEYHIPVLLTESISALITNPDGTYADATFGGGGHTAAILSRLHDGGSVIAFDRDSDALANAPKDPRLTLIHNNFRFIENYAWQLKRSFADAQNDRGTAGPEGRLSGAFARTGSRSDAEESLSSGPAVFDGILADLGVSSHQFDTAERGFSFRFEEAPLDMRMNREATLTAAAVVNSYEEADLERILRLYGEVDGARNMARLIVKARTEKALETTGDLDCAVAKMLPKGAEHKVLAKLYQALRIEVNQEMRSLEKFLEGATASLRPGGRLVVITYHSLEDRMVKNFIKTGNIEGVEQKDAFGRTQTPLEAVNRKPIVPQESEIAGNTRARSAKLRIAQRRAAL
ncbi:MAG: 16S rRNA (cytosine(1402)-N(4))-methyltransferase RsmH [Bacteroidales bacterium]|nr:16S rRNA (cytosine(1402)-N(4))-methyltransferase RsmH [Bacteroidales bacterium]